MIVTGGAQNFSEYRMNIRLFCQIINEFKRFNFIIQRTLLGEDKHRNMRTANAILCGKNSAIELARVEKKKLL